MTRILSLISDLIHQGMLSSYHGDEEVKIPCKCTCEDQSDDNHKHHYLTAETQAHTPADEPSDGEFSDDEESEDSSESAPQLALPTYEQIHSPGHEHVRTSSDPNMGANNTHAGLYPGLKSRLGQLQLEHNSNSNNGLHYHNPQQMHYQSLPDMTVEPSAPPLPTQRRAPSPPPRVRTGSIPGMASSSAVLEGRQRNSRDLYHTHSTPVRVQTYSHDHVSRTQPITRPSSTKESSKKNTQGYVSYKTQRINNDGDNAPGKWVSYWADLSERCLLLYPLKPGTEKKKSDVRRNVPKYIRLHSCIMNENSVCSDPLGGDKFVFSFTNQQTRIRHSFYLQSRDERSRWYAAIDRNLVQCIENAACVCDHERDQIQHDREMHEQEQLARDIDMSSNGGSLYPTLG
ncbi:hypothetical protein SARC_04828 [Sphaeroforma arctica JP610]|uniref:PH domain-containing protein n=1 Tax=Sphaeroforma arctica JP610 TaxID=667725 RepID=A0A0L0G1A9_9EUKA|nr:hypothetical protein SARC_04828 [Sphaeroforma arctica JP610]KNC82885.1 hypothetical protein SARC_04828 [Sphaeroforma arctica JP610]|eukprot:XP_014156787.1 hypothetical protein SARC_04828 [Sphaeroforma arctica JP610]